MYRYLINEGYGVNAFVKTMERNIMVHEKYNYLIRIEKYHVIENIHVSDDKNIKT